MFLYSFQIACSCFHPLHTSFCIRVLSGSPWYQLSLACLPSRVLSYGTLPIIGLQPAISGLLKTSSIILIFVLLSQFLDTNNQLISMILSKPSRIVLCEKMYVIFVNWDTWQYLRLNAVLYEQPVKFLLPLLSIKKSSNPSPLNKSEQNP